MVYRNWGKREIGAALYQLVQEWSYIKNNLEEMNLSNLEKKVNEIWNSEVIDLAKAYSPIIESNENFKLKLEGLYQKEQLEVIKEIARNKVKILVWGGSAYSLLGGQEKTKDLDYILLLPKELKESVEKLGYSKNNMNKEKADIKKCFMEEKNEILRYPFDLFDLWAMDEKEIKKNFQKVYENDNIEVYLPTKEFLANHFYEIGNSISAEKGYKETADKWLRRAKELKGLEINI